MPSHLNTFMNASQKEFLVLKQKDQAVLTNVMQAIDLFIFNLYLLYVP